MSPPFLLLAVLVLSAHGVPLSKLSATNDNRLYPIVIHTFLDGTVLISAIATYPYNELALHPIVSVPDPPASLSETILLAHVHPKNQTMIWATAITTMETSAFGVTADPVGNVYVAGLRHAVLDLDEGTVTVIKYSPSGKRLYEVSTAPPKYPVGGDYEGVRYRLAASSIDGKGILFYLPGGRLLMPSEALTKGGVPRLAVLTLSASSGEVLRVRPYKPPKHMRPYSMQLADFAVTTDKRKNRRSAVACFLFRATLKFSGSRERLYAQCGRPSGKRRVVTRLIDGSKVEFFRLNYFAMESDPPTTRSPSLFVAYERARNFSYDAPEGKSGATHELVLSRMDTATMKRVDWETGSMGDLMQPLVVTLPTPRYAGSSVSIISLQHLGNSNSVALLLSVTVKFLSISQQNSPGEGITITGGDEYIWPPTYWALYFNRKQKVKIRFHEDDPRTDKPSRFHIILTDMDFSTDEKCTRMFGFLSTEAIESGPLYIYNSPNPITSTSTDVC